MQSILTKVLQQGVRKFQRKSFFLSLGYGWLRCAPGVLGAFTNVLLLIYTSTQYSGWTATEKVGAVQMFFSRRYVIQISHVFTVSLKRSCLVQCNMYFWPMQIIFFVFLEHVIFGAKLQSQILTTRKGLG